MRPVLQDDAWDPALDPAPLCSVLYTLSAARRRRAACPVLSRALCCPCSVQRLVPQLGEHGDARRSAGHPESHLLHLRAGDAAHTHPRPLQSDGAGSHADGHPEEVRAAAAGRDGAGGLLPRPGAHRRQGAGERETADGNAARP